MVAILTHEALKKKVHIYSMSLTIQIKNPSTVIFSNTHIKVTPSNTLHNKENYLQYQTSASTSLPYKKRALTYATELMPL